MSRRHSAKHKLERARALRRHPTGAEARAWQILRGRRTLGLKFRRQHVIDGFVVDFYCLDLRVALEIDGEVHDRRETVEYDAARTDWLKARAIRVVRIRNDQVNQQHLHILLNDLLGSPSPHSRRGGQGVRPPPFRIHGEGVTG